jgi:hypothetical protein
MEIYFSSTFQTQPETADGQTDKNLLLANSLPQKRVWELANVGHCH